MAAKKSRLETRTVIYILLVVLIVLGVGYLILTFDVAEKPDSVQKIINNPQNYIGKKISVEGIYYTESESEVFLIDVYPTIADETPDVYLELNLEKINNSVIENLSEEQHYTATGTLVETTQYGVELKVDEIKPS